MQEGQSRKRPAFGQPAEQPKPQRHQAFGKQLFLGLSAWERHKKLLNEAITLYGGQLPTAPSQLEKTDFDILQEQHRFIRTQEDDKSNTWEVQLAKKYYSQLFREYCIADLSHYKEGKIGMRWRIQAELVSGKGQFICGAKNCDETRGLSSFEVNFAYREAGESKQALVKLRVCPKHAEQLNYKKRHKLAKAMRKRKRVKGEAADDGPDTSKQQAGAKLAEIPGTDVPQPDVNDDEIIADLLS